MTNKNKQRLSNQIVEILDHHFGEYLKDKPNKRKTVKGLIKALVLNTKDQALAQKEKEVLERVKNELITNKSGVLLTNGDDNFVVVDSFIEMLNQLKQK